MKPCWHVSLFYLYEQIYRCRYTYDSYCCSVKSPSPSSVSVAISSCRAYPLLPLLAFCQSSPDDKYRSHRCSAWPAGMCSSTSTMAFTTRFRNCRSWDTTSTALAIGRHIRLNQPNKPNVDVVNRFIQQQHIRRTQQQKRQACLRAFHRPTAY